MYRIEQSIKCSTQSLNRSKNIGEFEMSLKAIIVGENAVITK